MATATLSLRIIKDLVQDAPTDAGPEPAKPPRLRLLRAAFLPLHVYVRLDIPLPPASDPALSNERLALHLVGWPATGAASDGFAAATALAPPPAAATPRARTRRVLALLSCPEAPLGRYRVTLVRDGQTVGTVNIVRRADRVRLLTRTPPEPARPVGYVLISGTPKSGTTWLEKVVNAHPDFLVLHEANTLHMIETAAIAQHLDKRQDFFATRRIPWLPSGFDTRDFAPFLQMSLARDLMGRLGRAWGARYVADRTPGYADAYAHLGNFWEDARVLHIVRHPLDVVTSWLFHEAKAARDPARRVHLPRPVVDALNARLDAGGAVAPGEYVSDAAVAAGALGYFARAWRRDQVLARRAADDAPEQFHLLTYEALSSDFAAAARALFGFLGTDPARTDLARIEGDASFSALSGRAPGAGNPRSFFRKGVVGDWASVFSPTQAATIWAEVADVAGDFGYAFADAKVKRAKRAA